MTFHFMKTQSYTLVRLIVIILIIPFGLPVIGVSASDQSQAKFPTGIYRVYEECNIDDGSPKPPSGTRLMKYDQSAMTGVPDIPVRFAIVSAQPDVPLILAGKPVKSQDANNKTILNLKLENQYALQLETFTGANIGNRVAIIIGGKIISIHEVRCSITGGQLQITRCSDNACEKIYIELISEISKE